MLQMLIQPKIQIEIFTDKGRETDMDIQITFRILDVSLQDERLLRVAYVAKVYSNHFFYSDSLF
ncbi:MAG: hypothetical protein HUU45_13795 [Leptospiraceae bacterium]|nr:hypothetical protein [Leptospiraceae bacterium]